MAKGIGIKIVFSIVFATVSAAAGSIVTSKDSLWIYNNSRSGRWTDTITFINNASQEVRLDSVRLHMIEWDMSVYKPGAADAEVQFDEVHHGTRKICYGTLDSLDATEYYLDFSSGMSPRDSIFALGPSGDSSILCNLQIGYCFSCSLEKYPRYLDGTLRFYFSNGQIIGIRIYSDDLRPTGIQNPLSVRPVARTDSKKTEHLLNGRSVSGKVASYLRGHRSHRLISEK